MVKAIRLILAVSLVLAIVFINGTAFADHNYYHDDGEEAAAGLAVISTTTGITTTIAGGIALTVVLAADSASASKETYIRQNALALQQDVTLGGGQSIADLAAAFRVSEENLPTFADAIHSRRAQLLPLTDVDKLNGQRADQFFQIVVAAMQESPQLNAELQEITIFI